MESFRYSLILISTLAYVDLIARWFRLSFPLALPVTLAFQVLAMFFAGFARLPVVASWMMLCGGLFVAMLPCLFVLALIKPTGIVPALYLSADRATHDRRGV